MASGTQPQSTAFQIVGANPNLQVLPVNEWWLVTRMIDTFPYTGWDVANLKKNVTTFVVRALRKVTDKMTDDLRKNVSVAKKEDQAVAVESKNESLKFQALVVKSLLKLAETEEGIRGSDHKAVVTRLLEFVPSDAMNHSGTAHLIHGLEKIKRGELDDLNQTMQVAVNMLAKRSAHFKNAKEHLIKALDVSESKAKEVVATIDTQVEKIKTETGAYEVKIQNKHSVVGLDKGGLLGDAELNRLPWTITKDPLDEDELKKRIHYCLTGTDLDVTKVEKKESTEVAVVEEKQVIQMFRDKKGGEKALKLSENLESFECQQICKFEKLPVNEYLKMMKFIGYENKADVDRVTREVVEILLLGWQDVVAAEGKAIHHLKV